MALSQHAARDELTDAASFLQTRRLGLDPDQLRPGDTQRTVCQASAASSLRASSIHWRCSRW